MTVSDETRERDRLGLEILPYEECMRLLTKEVVGRLSYVDAGEPTIIPVNFRVYGSSIVFRTSFGGKHEAAMLGRPAAFQIDEFDAVYQKGWSVLVKGILESVDDLQDLEELAELSLTPWARETVKPFWVRLIPNEVTGRRIA